MRRRVAIVGGGITGLAAARGLERLTDAEIDLYEASSRLGGKLETDRIEGLLVERGPDCFFTRKPGVLDTVRELGLEGRLIAPAQREFGMLLDGAIHRVPAGLVALNAVRAEAVHEATFLSIEAKTRALDEASVPSGEEEDESIRSFFARRFGPEFGRLVAEPLLAGTHGGDADRLSMAALFPAYLEWERKPRTVSPPQGEGSAAFLSFDGGMGVLAEAFAADLGRTRVHLDARLDALPDADRTLVAVPANRAASLLPGIGLEAIGHGTTAISTLAFRREDVGHPLDGTGFLVPGGEPVPFTGVTWSSAKWVGRAPEDRVLMRVFMRGRRSGEEVLHALTPLLGLRAAPVYACLDVWTDAQPQYEMGHFARVAAIERALPERVWIAGTSFRGVGVPDCLRQGRDAARSIAQTL